MKTGVFGVLPVLLPLLCYVEGIEMRRAKVGTVYEAHDLVDIVVNKVGPFNNPTETYRYYSLPFCKTHSTQEEEEEAARFENVNIQFRGSKREGALSYRQSVGEWMVGDRRETSPYEITFGDSVEWRLLCQMTLETDDLIALKEAIHKDYFFEMFVEDLPMWGYIGDTVDEDIIMGEMAQSKTYLFPHLHFYLGHNENRIVAAKITTDMDRRVDITHVNKPQTVQFSYSVDWYPDSLTWAERMSRYDSRFLPGSFEVHSLSVIHSFVLVLLLTAFFAGILRRVHKKSFSEYLELDNSLKEESGWKQLHGDVFRLPERPGWLCACVGVGNHLIVMALLHLCLTLSGIMSTMRRGSLLAGAIVLYCLTSIVGGFTSVRAYRQMNGENWVRCIVLTTALFPTPVAIVAMWVNSVALAHGSTSALPSTVILRVLALFIFICFPLTLLGGLLAKNYASAVFNAPTFTSDVAREIPTGAPWYTTRAFHVLIAGFLPFTAIHIELNYICASMSGYPTYTFFGILLADFVLLIMLASLISVVLLYFQLSRENHRWWWPSYINGGMTGLFIYFYSFFYYFHRSGMTGVLQSSFYFGYMGICSFALFLMLGSAGFQLSMVFVRYIYST